MVLKDQATKQSWQIFKSTLHRSTFQELSIPGCKKPGKRGEADLSELRAAGKNEGQQ